MKETSLEHPGNCVIGDMKTYGNVLNASRTHLVGITTILAGLAILSAPQVKADLFTSDYMEASGTISDFSFWTREGESQLETPLGNFALVGSVFYYSPEDSDGPHLETYLTFKDRAQPQTMGWDTHEQNYYSDGYCTWGFQFDTPRTDVNEMTIEAYGYHTFTLGSFSRVWSFIFNIDPITVSYDGAQNISITGAEWHWRAELSDERGQNPHTSGSGSQGSTSVPDAGAPLVLLGFGLTGLIVASKVSRVGG